MAFEYCQGKWLHDAVYKRNDPVARQVKSLWASQGDVTYGHRKQEVIAQIGQMRWDVLSIFRAWVGDEAFYLSVYDALRSAGAGASLPLIIYVEPIF